ncbi:RNaseH domain-containing protein [Streptomyces chryseus]|uniref:RNaseH domain-containing protein n=1 Tax=Streptomyces chryseus TaxID=68186 RepID=UPI001476D9B0
MASPVVAHDHESLTCVSRAVRHRAGRAKQGPKPASHTAPPRPSPCPRSSAEPWRSSATRSPAGRASRGISYPVGVAGGVDRTMLARATARLCHRTIAWSDRSRCPVPLYAAKQCRCGFCFRESLRSREESVSAGCSTAPQPLLRGCGPRTSTGASLASQHYPSTVGPTRGDDR